MIRARGFGPGHPIDSVRHVEASMARMEELARKLLSIAKEFGKDFEVCPATARTHPHVRWADYDRILRVMEGLGFRLVGDYQPVGLRVPDGLAGPGVERFMFSHDGTIVADYHRMTLRWTLRAIAQRLRGFGRAMLNLQTVFNEDTWVLLQTTTSDRVGSRINPPFILREYHPQMPPAALLARHRERVAEYAREHPAARVERVHTFDEMRAKSRETMSRIREFRRSIGWIAREELEWTKQLTPGQLDELCREIRRLVAEEEEHGAVVG
jgi:hypothetical protein